MSEKKKLLITKVSDTMMWYKDLVGTTVDLVQEYPDCYLSRDKGGYTNVVRKEDASVVIEMHGIDFTDPKSKAAQDEYFNILQEECAEVIQSVSKIKRFGWTETNITNLQTEIGDLLCMLDMLKKYAPKIASANFDELKNKKLTKLQTYSSLV